MKQQKRRLKRIATGAATTAAAVGISASLAFSPISAQASTGLQTRHHASVQRKAPAWREGLRTAEAKVLGLTSAEYKTARKTKKLPELVQEAGLTPEQFTAKMKLELTAEWKAKGVSDKDITSRLAKLAKYQNRREHRWETER